MPEINLHSLTLNWHQAQTYPHQDKYAAPCDQRKNKKKPTLSNRLFLVAGTGLEPATSGL